MNNLIVQKSVNLNGNLKSKFIYRPCPQNEFIYNYKFLSIGNAAYKTKSPPSQTEICIVSCNFVQSQKYSETSEVISYEQPLLTFALKGINSHRFTPHWFPINNLSSQLEFTITFLSQSVNIDCDLILTVYFA